MTSFLNSHQKEQISISLRQIVNRQSEIMCAIIMTSNYHEVIMYFIVSWDISANEPVKSRINSQMKDCFKTFSQVRPVKTYYLVKVETVEQYQRIHNSLKTAANNRSVAVNFVMSPLYPAQTAFIGKVPTDMWHKVNQITG